MSGPDELDYDDLEQIDIDEREAERRDDLESLLDIAAKRLLMMAAAL